MNRAIYVSIILILTLAVLPTALLGKTHRIQLLSAALINGVELEPGTYKMRMIGDNTVEIFDGKKLVAKSRVEIQPIGDAIPNSVSQKSDGTVVEIRLKKERVVLVTS